MTYSSPPSSKDASPSLMRHPFKDLTASITAKLVAIQIHTLSIVFLSADYWNFSVESGQRGRDIAKRLRPVVLDQTAEARRRWDVAKINHFGKHL